MLKVKEPGMVTLSVTIDQVAYNVLDRTAKGDRRTPEDQAAIILEEALYWNEYGQFEKPDDPNQVRRVAEANKSLSTE